MTKQYPPVGKVETPFAPQFDHYDQVVGHIKRENQLLRTITIIAVVSFFLSIGISLYAVAQPDSIPVLVTMNDFGQASYVGAVSRKNYQDFNVPEIAIQYQVKEFLSLYYTLSTDKIVMKKNLNKVYHCLTSNTASRYSTMIREENPFEKFGKETREIQFIAEPIRLSKNTYQINYKVITRQLTGNIKDNQTYLAVITVKVLQPTDDDIKDNPLGIYITEFDMKQVDKNVYTEEEKK